MVMVMVMVVVQGRIQMKVVAGIWPGSPVGTPGFCDDEDEDEDGRFRFSLLLVLVFVVLFAPASLPSRALSAPGVVAFPPLSLPSFSGLELLLREKSSR